MKACLAMETYFFFKLSSSVLLTILIALLQMHGYESCLETERLALLELKTSFISVSDTQYADQILASWVDDDDPISDCCGWDRVKCNATTRRVMQLSLDQATSVDPYVPPLLNLSLFHPFQELQSLDLSWNFFEGVYENKSYDDDDSVGSLNQLKILNLTFNNFNDNILPYINKLTSLTTLILAANRIKGLESNKGLGNLRNLQVLSLSSNHDITSASLTRLGLANLTNLEVLDLSGIRIGESISGLGLAKFKKLKALGLSDNKINGSLENQGICDLKNLFELDLSINNFEGNLPQCLSNLSRLKVLDISSNQLTGNLPSVIGNLNSLEYLSLSYNKFQGVFSLCSLANHSNLEVFLLLLTNNNLRVKTEGCTLTFQLRALQLSNCKLSVMPSFLFNQYSLKYLDLSYNKLAGNFPSWLLQNNTRLEILYLSNNSFTGILQLPNAKHDFLRHLHISRNNFSGKLPENMGIVLHKSEYLNMSNNNFQGDIPDSICEMMKYLEVLDLSRNNFSGELSSTTLFTGCLSLQMLHLSDNKFYGQIFPKYMYLNDLEWLYLDNNNFNGKIEDGLLNSTSLSILDISNNMLSGHIPSWMGNFSSSLVVLQMSKNHLEGNIPSEFNNLEYLQLLDISENCLSGYMTPSLNLSSLKHLYLKKNSFYGSIPNALFRSSELLTLDLTHNEFSGRIPREINTLSNLRVLLLRENYLQGPIPNQLCELQKLGILDLSHNRLNGSIPSCFTAVSFWTIRKDYFLYGDERTFEGGWTAGFIGFYNSSLHLMLSEWQALGTEEQVKFELVIKNRHEFYNGSNLNYMSGLDLSCNELTGEIPTEIGDLEKIYELNLSHNLLWGRIPESFSNLKRIESLDLSHNKLSGRIPPALIELNFLSNFYVSYNNLSGPIPDKLQFATFDEKNYRGNPGLCGSTINKSCSKTEEIPSTSNEDEEEEEGESVIDMVAFNWSFGASYVTFILGLFAVLWINSYWRWLWFCFIEACIDWCFYWFVKFAYCIRGRARP